MRHRLDGVDVASTIALLGSGDFHHVAALLHERVREPFTLVHFDNHPDWVRLAPHWHCGSWLNRTLALPHLARAVTLGPCSDDLVRPGFKGGNLRALDSGRLALFPWHHEPSRIWRRIADGPGHRVENGLIRWRNLDERSLPEAIGMPLDALLEFLRAIRARKRVIGADICGEYAPIAHANAWKRIESRLDQPQRDTVDATRLAANERVNRALIASLAGAHSAC
jgi:hypothetical protein